MSLASPMTGSAVSVNVPPIPPHMRILMDQERVYVFSVNPKAFDRPQGCSGMFKIPACEPGQRVSAAIAYQGKPGIPRIIPETVVDDFDPASRKVTQKWDFSTDGTVVARDICGLNYSPEQPENMTRYGVFVAAGPVPTEAEISAAEKARDAEYRRLVLEADNYYRVNGGMETNNGKTMSNINPLHVEALMALGLTRDWAQGDQPVVVTLTDCPFCGVSTKPGVAFCPAGCVLDEAKARIARPHLFAAEPEKRGPGRPRAEAA